MLGVAVDDAYRVLPPTRALWLPAGVVHRTGATRDAVLCSLYLEPDRCGLDWTEPTPVSVDRLLAHLIAYLNPRTSPTTCDCGPRQSNWICCTLCRLGPSMCRIPSTNAYAPWPTPCLPIPRSLEAHARAVGVSRRTLTRLFVHDTGMSFNRWRTHMRLRAALPLLAEGIRLPGRTRRGLRDTKRVSRGIPPYRRHLPGALLQRGRRA
ncbi:hypothetical protein GCM10023097_74640 [Streptomyces collinus]